MTAVKAAAKRPAARRRSAAEWRVILEQFERSGMAAAAFCTQSGLHVETLRHWRRKLRSTGQSEFVELRPSPARWSPGTGPAHGRWSLDITFPDGTTARLGG